MRGESKEYKTVEKNKVEDKVVMEEIRNKKLLDIQKTNSKMAEGSCSLSVITMNVNELTH